MSLAGQGNAYERAVETKRPAGSRRIEVFSPKSRRRLTLFSWSTHDAWLLLEADPTVRVFFERSAYVDGEAGRVSPLVDGALSRHAGMVLHGNLVDCGGKDMIKETSTSLVLHELQGVFT